MQRWRRTLAALTAVTVTSLAVSARATAQGPAHATRWLVAAEVGGLRSNHPYQGGPGSYGVSVALERAWTQRLAVRTVLGWAESFATGDDVAICRPTGAGTCYPDAYFPLRLWTLAADGVYTPDRKLPLALVAGAGLALPVGIRRNIRVTDHLEHDRALKGIARLGASLGLGGSVRAPRLQYTRGWLSGPYASFDRIDQLALVVVF